MLIPYHVCFSALQLLSSALHHSLVVTGSVLLFAADGSDMFCMQPLVTHGLSQLKAAAAIVSKPAW